MRAAPKTRRTSSARVTDFAPARASIHAQPESCAIEKEGVRAESQIDRRLQILVVLRSLGRQQADDDAASSLELGVENSPAALQVCCLCVRHGKRSITEFELEQIDDAAAHVEQKVDLCIACAVLQVRPGDRSVVGALGALVMLVILLVRRPTRPRIAVEQPSASG